MVLDQAVLHLEGQEAVQSLFLLANLEHIMLGQVKLEIIRCVWIIQDLAFLRIRFGKYLGHAVELTHDRSGAVDTEVII